jgi:hypothetical protein
MVEKSRRRLLAGALVILAIAIFGMGINWGLPSHAIDPILFGAGPDSATTALNSYNLTGVGIIRLAGDWNGNGNLPSDVAAHPIADRTQPITLLENRHGETVTSSDDVSRARILSRFRLYSYQPDEMISFRALAMMHPANFQFDPKLYQYGGLWIYPLGAIVKAASLVGYVTVSPDPALYLDSPDIFGRFYILGRAYSAAWGVVAVLAIFGFVRRISGGLLLPFLAAVCFMCMPVVIDLAHEAKPHLAGTALLLLAILSASKYVETGKGKWIVWTAIACGACAGMILSGVVALVILPVMTLVRRDRPGRFLAVCAGGFLISIAVYFAANPYVAIHLALDRTILESNFANTRAMYSIGDARSSIENAFRLLLSGTGLPLAGFGALGVILAPVSRRPSPVRGLGWLLGIPALIVLIQFALFADGKPGEYARFALLADTALMLSAFIAVARSVRSVALRFGAGMILTAVAAMYSAAYERGFINDSLPDDSRMQAAAAIDERLASAGQSPVLYITAEPAPYCLPPVNLFRWRMILLPRGGEIPAGFPAGILVKPHQAVDALNPSATPISWANIGFDMADVGGK